jgi:hypothetical protein
MAIMSIKWIASGLGWRGKSHGGLCGIPPIADGKGLEAERKRVKRMR